MKRGDLYSFQISRGFTRTGTIVRIDKDSITVLYKADKNLRTRKVLKKDIIRKNIMEGKC